MRLHVSALATHMSLNFAKWSITADRWSVFAESLSLVNFALDQFSNVDCSDCCERAVGLGGWCQRETRGTEPQTRIVPWLHRHVLHTSSRLNFCELRLELGTPLRPALCRLRMRWTRLHSRILGTGTSTTRFRMRSETRSEWSL